MKHAIVLMRQMGRVLLPATIAVLTLTLLRLLPPRAFVAYNFLGIPLLLWVRRPFPKEWLATGLVGVVLACWYHGLQWMRSDPSAWIAATVFGVGSSAILVTAAALARSRGEARESALRDVAALSSMPFMLFAGIQALVLVTQLTPATFDSAFTAVDRSLGFDPSFLAGRFLHSNPMAERAGQFVYDVLPTLVMGVAALRRWQLGALDDSNILLGVVVAGGISMVCFLVVPACGPVYLWQAQFPSSPPTGHLALLPTLAAPGAFRNALPSMHMVGAILVYWGTRGLPLRWRGLGATNLALTVVVTLGTGQHYAVDLVAALPTAVIAVALADGGAGWRRRCTVGMLGLAAWITVLRAGTSELVDTPGLTWGIVLMLTLAMLSVSGAGVRGPRPQTLSHFSDVAESSGP